MIRHEEIRDLVVEWDIREDVIEKDYAIGWLLWGLGSESALRDSWVFKGGTCLKKSYLETYRFSEDLDFTVIKDGPISPEQVEPLLTSVLERVTEESGINFLIRPPVLRSRPAPLSTQGRVYYTGPRNTRTPGSIKLDLLGTEIVARPGISRSISHPFSDTLPTPGIVLCYSLEELFAEKIRAFGERCRPRDLYDIIFLFRRGDFRNNANIIRTVLIDKCTTKGVPVPTYTIISTSPARQELEAAWANMLAHQLPELPPFAAYWDELPEFFAWLEGTSIPETLPSLKVGRTPVSTWAPPPTVGRWDVGIPLESIRFAAANRLCVELGYNGIIRLIEPYAFRQSKVGGILLYAIRTDNKEPRSYRVDRIESIKVTQRSFTPTYTIEISERGPGQG